MKLGRLATLQIHNWKNHSHFRLAPQPPPSPPPKAPSPFSDDSFSEEYGSLPFTPRSYPPPFLLPRTRWRWLWADADEILLWADKFCFLKIILKNILHDILQIHPSKYSQTNISTQKYLVRVSRLADQLSFRSPTSSYLRFWLKSLIVTPPVLTQISSCILLLPWIKSLVITLENVGRRSSLSNYLPLPGAKNIVVAVSVIISKTSCVWGCLVEIQCFNLFVMLGTI